MNQNPIRYTIASEVFGNYPGYVRGVVVANDIRNGDSPAALVQMLREAEAGLRARLKPDAVAQDPRIASWREAYRAFGAKPSEFRPSMEAMARRVLKNNEIPSISTLVDIGNVLSLRRLVPAGGHAIGTLTQDIALRPATGEEEFVAFGSEVMEHPLPGEIVFVEGNTVLTRRWTWRQARHTLIVPETTALELNVDGLPPVTPVEVEEICREAMELIGRFCGGNMRYELLTQQNPSMQLS